MADKSIEKIVEKETIQVSKKEYVIDGFPYGTMRMRTFPPKYVRHGIIKGIVCVSDAGPGHLLAQQVSVGNSAFTRYFGWAEEQYHAQFLKQRETGKLTFPIRKIVPGQKEDLVNLCKKARLPYERLEQADIVRPLNY